ncbi:MAG TPA: YicC/YloC family endoribonuclease [Ignavibacteriaceae bacterium]|nr:YicC/YloC family endoribonuclease [Ignavibacteriaceae bacterium]
MIYSMTGYGRGTAGNKNISIEAEIKSINSRYLDLFFRLPSYLQSKEYELREQVKNKIKRGKVTTIIMVKGTERDTEILAFNKPKLKAFTGFLKDLKKAAGITEKIKLEHVLSFKELFLADEFEFGEEEFILAKQAIDSAIKDLLKMKENEGGELAKDLVNRIKSIEDKVDMIEKESMKSVDEYFSILKQKVRTLVEDITQYNDRLGMELALIAERSDITEECVRLKSHLKFFIDSIVNDEEPGRKLNFICQEMNREANTISSKSLSTEITRNSVLIKEEIERIREQIQNIE